LSEGGVVTPDHTIRTKNWPLVLPHAEKGKLADFARAAREAAAQFVARYRATSSGTTSASAVAKSSSIPCPASCWCPGLGLFGLGRTKHDAVIAADIAEEWMRVVSNAEASAAFESISEADMFDCEYWPLEQAKLGARKEPPLAGQIAVVTGAGGAIGAATAKAFAGGGRGSRAARRQFRRASETAKAIGLPRCPSNAM
jgi:hypothetical protein